MTCNEDRARALMESFSRDGETMETCLKPLHPIAALIDAAPAQDVLILMVLLSRLEAAK